MRVIRNSFFLIVYFLLAVAANAHTVTWVSGTGNDNNPCTRIAPCATFAGALTKTLPGGEIDALDAGNYGPLIINKAVTINGNSVATIAVEDLEGGILINAGASDVVILRNIELNGLGSAVEGILFDSGKALQIDHCKIPDSPAMESWSNPRPDRYLFLIQSVRTTERQDWQSVLRLP